ncbi:hypothetical protein [Nostoc sp.]
MNRLRSLDFIGTPMSVGDVTTVTLISCGFGSILKILAQIQ